MATKRDIYTQRLPDPRGRNSWLAWPARFAFAVLSILVLGVAVAAGAGLVMYQDHVDEFVQPAELGVNQPYAGARIYDRHGTLLYEMVHEEHGLRRPVRLSEVSPYMIAATIATEDNSFFRNPGINLRGIARAGWENFGPFAGGDGAVLQGTGGSSITQQLAKQLYIPESDRFQRSMDRKVREAIFALELTRLYEKPQILEWYLNQISYGGIYYGVEAASQGYFGKSAKELTLAEAAMLAGLPQSPAELEPVNHPEAAQWRRDEVLEIMRRTGVIQVGENEGDVLVVSSQEIDAAKAEAVSVLPARFDVNAPHFVFSYLRPRLEALFGPEALYQDGLVVTTSLDLEMQKQSIGLLERRIRDFEAVSSSRNGAATIINPRTGEILVYIGSRDYWREDIQGRNDNLLSLNSPGSSFKPFVYLTTFLKLGWGPNTPIVDEPVTFREADGTTFSPTNPTDQYYGRITIRQALGNSLNIPPFKAARDVGVHEVVNLAKQFGFSTLTGQYGPSIATGGVDLTAIDLAYAYAGLAANGRLTGVEPILPVARGESEIEPMAILKVTNRNGEVLYDATEKRRELQVVPPEYAYAITHILADSQAHCLTFGCGGLNVPGKQVAVKTGTSSPFDPNGPLRGRIGETWAFGYTADLVVGIWAGNADNSPINNIYSTTISFRAMSDLMVNAYGTWPQAPFEVPPAADRILRQQPAATTAPQPQQGAPQQGGNQPGVSRPAAPQQPAVPQPTAAQPGPPEVPRQVGGINIQQQTWR